MAKQAKRPTKKEKQAETLAPIGEGPFSFESPESSLLMRGDYDPLSATLSVEFTSGKTYTYAGVTAKTWGELLAAESKGKAFNSLVRPFILGREKK